MHDLEYDAQYKQLMIYVIYEIEHSNCFARSLAGDLMTKYNTWVDDWKCHNLDCERAKNKMPHKIPIDYMNIEAIENRIYDLIQ